MYEPQLRESVRMCDVVVIRKDCELMNMYHFPSDKSAGTGEWVSGLLLSASSRDFAQNGPASHATSLLVEMLTMELELLSLPRPLEGVQAQPDAAAQGWASP